MSISNPLQVKSILISQPEPTDIRSPFYELMEKYKVEITFRQFIKVEGVVARDFRKDKVNILDHTAIILTSRIAIEHLFRMCTEMRVELPADMKYFCVTEAVALYLQKFITYRKRKVFYPKLKEQELYDSFLKHKTDKYLFPRADVGNNNEITELFRKNNLSLIEAVIYRTVASDLTDLKDVYYDIIAFFSPSGIKSLYENFPNFVQNNTRIAGFGASTCQAIRDIGLRLDIEAPTPQTPSMKMALEEYIKVVNK